ncbi:16S rRNA (guanine(527)-N(7))-methyltransferase RsmG [Paenibacillus mendelii]|uniref:Ribosomal RNA small subunit methyltransferase G n=1 Tax=Paenibacillus mendelii TaxID=206163 RepID=A0ABV6JEC4_9BACL|nr:16S rRNA (guanine(527)-N(7))-methyltransferase RsmG [Paenibacillus mendelii]MCQ6563418.1 16S rRNA (guanine(527)-N(7))-methyltransferase RsmG [Paenibacillus mendelii]
MNHTESWFVDLLHKEGVSLTDQQLQQFDLYYQLLVEWNEKMNLTGITEREAVYEKHFYDSVSLSFFLDLNKAIRFADIGSGAGFPSIPLKICFPHLEVTMVDSLNKRLHFLKHVIEALGLQQMNCVHGRAEDMARLKEHRDQYDVVTARAVARLNILNELCLPFVRIGGKFAAMKGADPASEVNEAQNSLIELKADVQNVHHLTLPHEQSDRHIVIVNKTGATPKKYPRKAGLPGKQPIV